MSAEMMYANIKVGCNVFVVFLFCFVGAVCDIVHDVETINYMACVSCV